MLIALLLTSLGMVIFTLFFSSGGMIDSLTLLYEERKLGALISLGALPNLPVFFYLLKKNNFEMAYGMVGFLLIMVALVAGLKVL